MTRYEKICQSNQDIFHRIEELYIKQAELEWQMPSHSKYAIRKRTKELRQIKHKVKKLKSKLDAGITLSMSLVKTPRDDGGKIKPSVRVSSLNPVILSYLWNEDNSPAEIAKKQAISEERVKYLIDGYEKRKNNLTNTCK